MSDQEKTPDTIASQQWKNITKDFVILIALMGTIGYGLKVAMDQLKPVSPSDALTASIVDTLITDEDKESLKSDKSGDKSKAIISEILAGKREASPISKSFITVLETESKGNTDFINSVNNNDITPLMWICYFNAMNPENQLEVDFSRARYVKYMLQQQGIDFKAKDKEGFTALHWAAWSGLPQCCKILVEAGIPIDSLEDNGYSPLALAAMRGNADTVEMLLSLNANKQLPLKSGQSILEVTEQRAQAYHSSATSWLSFAYSLIYNSERDEDYRDTVKLLK